MIILGIFNMLTKKIHFKCLFYNVLKFKDFPNFAFDLVFEKNQILLNLLDFVISKNLNNNDLKMQIQLKLKKQHVYTLIALFLVFKLKTKKIKFIVMLANEIFVLMAGTVRVTNCLCLATNGSSTLLLFGFIILFQLLTQVFPVNEEK